MAWLPLSLRSLCVAGLLALVPTGASAQQFTTVYEAHLAGATVVPATASTATGYVTVGINPAETMVYFGIRFTGLSGPNTSVHLHAPADPGSNGPMIMDFPITGQTSVSNTSLSSISPVQLAFLKNGQWYVDVHSAAFPDGEIRGNFRPASPFVAAMDGMQNVTPSGAAATGVAKFGVDELTTPMMLTYMVSFNVSGTPTAIHLHGPALAGANGPIITTISGNPGANANFYSFATITPSQLAELRAGLWYYDVHTALHPNGEIRGQFKIADKATEFDGDGRAELGVFRPSGGTWYLQNPGTGAFTGHAFGLSDDVLTPADFDGDGRTDRAVWRSGTFYVWQSSSNSLRVQAFGAPGDVPQVSGDYDGDGKADFAVWRPGATSVLYILQSTNGALRAVPWGTSSDLTQLGDYDGDRRRDPAVYRPGTNTFYVLQSTAGFGALAFGSSLTDSLTPGDYDADGKTDFAVWRTAGPDAAWYILQSSTSTLRADLFGLGSNRAVPADFDGDNKNDLAVVRQTGGTLVWYVLRSATGTLLGLGFGADTDFALQRYLVR